MLAQQINIFLVINMKRQYSFTEIPSLGAVGLQNPPINQPNFTSIKPRESWTNKRVEEIKKKYDTPSHRKNYSNFGNQNRSKDNQPMNPPNDPYMSSFRHPLGDSLTSNIVRRDRNGITMTGSYKQSGKYQAGWQENIEIPPRPRYDRKQNQSSMYVHQQLDQYGQSKSSTKLEFRSSSKEYQVPSRDGYRNAAGSSMNGGHIDPRVQNIDKINMKIKKILDSFNQPDKGLQTEMKASLGNQSAMGRGAKVGTEIIQSWNKGGYDVEQPKLGLQKSMTNLDKYSRNQTSTSSTRYHQEYQPQQENPRLEQKYENQYEYTRMPNKQSIPSYNATNTSYTRWNAGETNPSNLNQNTKIEENTDILPAKKSDTYQLKVRKQERQESKVEDSSDSWFEPQPQPQPQATGLQNNRSKSCLQNMRDSDETAKKVDDEISKINIRIKEFEEEKKKLNIDFKPYNQLRYNRSSSNLSQHKSQKNNRPPLPKPNTKTQQNNSSYTQTRHQRIKTQSNIDDHFNRHSYDFQQDSYDLQTRYSFDGGKNYQPPKQQDTGKNLNRNLSSIDVRNCLDVAPMFGIKNNSYELSNEDSRLYNNQSREEQQHNAQKQAQEPVQDEQPPHEESQKVSRQLKQKTQQGIEQRKRKLLETVTGTFSRQTKRLITNLFQQVKLDQSLRNSKIWLRDLPNPNKYQLLRKQAEARGLKFEISQFQITDQEDNPFYSVRQCSGEDFFHLVQKWVQAQGYWTQHILAQFDLREFQVQMFTDDKVDLHRKGYFVVEDLVRFLNMETGTFYRNRDLILIFRRLTSSERIEWPQFLAKLDRESPI